MKKFAAFTLFFILSMTFIAGAQDVIYKSDGSKEDAKILLVGDKEIQYKKFNNPEGPVYSMNKSEITMITYENGEYEMLKSQTGVAKSNKQELAENFAKNLVTYHLFDVVYGDFTFSYERILSSGTIGIIIPVSFGYAYNSDYYNSSGEWVKNMFYSGIGVNFYPTGQGKWRYFLGPNVRIGYGKQNYGWYYDDYGNYVENNDGNEGIYTKFFVDNGVMFTPVKNLSISTIVGVGMRFFPEADDSYNVVMPTAHFSVNLHYRF